MTIRPRRAWLWLLLLSSALHAAAPTPPTKANVLFIISDDLNCALGCYGHPQCLTPALDALAERSVRFTNMHCQMPVCGASRCSLMAGLYPYTTEGLAYNSTLQPLRAKQPDFVSLPQLFRDHGYHVARVSKVYHMNIPHSIASGTTAHDDAPSWDEVVNVQSPEHESAGKKDYWTPANTGSQTFLSIECSGDDSSQADGMAADHAIDFLHRQAEAERPFFLALGLVRPHVPLVAPKAYFDLYNQADMQLPVVVDGDHDDLPDAPRSYKGSETEGMHGLTKNTPDLHRGLLRAYYASVSYMDAQVGRVLNTLDELGLRERTIIVFTSDHGYHLGEHYKWQKQHLFEESTRVPFLLSVPWLSASHGQANHGLSELIDLYPTLADLAHLPAPSYLHGTSLTPLLRDVSSDQWTKQAVFTVSRSGGESLRTHDWRFTQWDHGSGGYELYDLNADPGEFTNLSADPAHTSIREELRAQLLEHRQRAGYSERVKQLRPTRKP
ncbi:MAG: sulfatase [Planctomycetota bacterium]|jgi:arylsulfatase A-like enzyme